jgi:hypothetical protein
VCPTEEDLNMLMLSVFIVFTYMFMFINTTCIMFINTTCIGQSEWRTASLPWKMEDV